MPSEGNAVAKHSSIVGSSDALRQCLEYAGAVAQSDASVLVEGESGVGKELIATHIHENSPRSKGKLITVNCASVPRDLFESEFFGHVKGAFTGASRDRAGRFEAAHRGTLFLDEVGEIPPELQGKLLRALQQGSFERVGEDRTRTVDVRIIAATNRTLADEVEKGRFRRDLFYRLSTLLLEVPPLRERVDDIIPLSKEFLRQLAGKYRSKPPRLSYQDTQRLLSHDWPGNVRELKNVIERAFVIGRARGKFSVDLGRPEQAKKNPKSTAPKAQSSEPANSRGFMTAAEFAELERDNLVAAMEAARWKISGIDGAAALLGMKASTLSSRLKALNIDRPKKTSLYWQLGGEYRIAVLARELLGRVQADPQLGRFWIDRSTAGIRREERFLAQFLCAALGGPRPYQGETMEDAHRDLGITHGDWNVFRQHLAAALEAMGINEPARGTLQEMAESLRDEIVET